MKIPLLRIAFLAGVAAAVFLAARPPLTALAQSPPPLVAHYYRDITLITPPTISPQARVLVVAQTQGAKVLYLVGTLPAHTHKDSNEIQYVISGNGSEYFGNCRVVIGPGTLLVIPHGMIHSGMTVRKGPLKILAVLTPPGTDHIAASPLPCTH